MIPILEILRREESEAGTIGILGVQKKIFCVTLEPWDWENKAFESSIPAQQYRCERIHSPQFGETFQVMNVPGRTNILFHAGNRVRDTEGCIILAQHVGKLRGDRAVLNSGETFRRFLSLLRDHNELHLTIMEVY